MLNARITPLCGNYRCLCENRERSRVYPYRTRGGRTTRLSGPEGYCLPSADGLKPVPLQAFEWHA